MVKIKFLSDLLRMTGLSSLSFFSFVLNHHYHRIPLIHRAIQDFYFGGKIR